MQTIHADRAPDNRLRFVFSDKVVAFDVAANLTFGELARKFAELSDPRYGDPLGIDVRLPPRFARRAY